VKKSQIKKINKQLNLLSALGRYSFKRNKNTIIYIVRRRKPQLKKRDIIKAI